jgi:hypothetical protein
VHLLSLSLLACVGSGTLNIGSPGDKGDETGLAEEEEEQDDPIPDFSRWVGTRDVFVGDCEGRLDEEGARLDADWEHYDLAESWCLECDGFYRVEVSPDRVCGMDAIPTLYRALWYDEEGDAAIYNLDLDGNRWELEALDEHASFDGWNLEYDYNILTWGEDPWVEGRIEFPRVSP